MMTTEHSSVSLWCVDSLASEIGRTYERIRNRAYEYSAANGNIAGSEVDDWVSSERELISKPRAETRSQDDRVIVDLAISPVDPAGITIRITPCEMLITSEPDSADRQLFRVIRFPKPILPESVHAEMAGEKLRICATMAQESAAGPQPS